MKSSIRFCAIALLYITVLPGCAINHRFTKSLPAYFTEDGQFARMHTGFVVFDPGQKKYLAEIKADHRFTPASNIKLWTVFAAMQILGDSVPAFAYCKYNGRVYFKGMGDPTFLHPAYPAQPAFDALQHLADTLHYIPARDHLPRYGPGWAWDDYPYYFQVERSRMPLYGNVVHIQSTPQGDIVVIPHAFENVVSFDFDTIQQPDPATRPEYSNTFTVHGRATENVEIPFLTSDSLTVSLLADTLGIPVLIGPAGPPCTRWNVVYNGQTSKVYKDILVDSDNFLAEQLLLSCAVLLTDTARQQVATDRILKSFFPQHAGLVQWVDGSGLSRYNQCTPRSMVDVLYRLYETMPLDRLLDMLPAGGMQGTLKNAFSASEPYVYAKTGSMRNVYNLSGFLRTDSGRILIFSFMNNHVDRPFYVLKQDMAEILETIKRDYR